MTGVPQIECMIWVLDDDMETLGTVSAITREGERPIIWRVAVRPRGIEGHRFLDFADLGRCASCADGIETVRLNAWTHRGRTTTDGGETG